MVSEQDLALAQSAFDVRKAFREGKLQVQPDDAIYFAELMAAQESMTGVIDISAFSPGTKSFVQASGMALRQHRMMMAAPAAVMSPAEGQAELFRLFGLMFTALTGTGPAAVTGDEDIQQRMIWRFKHEAPSLATNFNDIAKQLEDFYTGHATNLFTQAKALGGLKLVTGGQRAFGQSALRGARITALYADTQLIPDPIFPFLGGNLHLNAMHLQLAIALYNILQLAPLVEAKLPVPPVFLFPSFETQLEENDIATKAGFSALALQLVTPVCNGTITSLEELFEYARMQEDEFLAAVMAEHLFVPPGSDPTEQLSGKEAVARYLEQLKGVRDEKVLEQLRRAPPGALVLNGILERLRPQYHLYENSDELDAQPLLSQAVHWHYYEKCAQASAKDLVRKQILSEQSFQTLRALQDDSLDWLASVPVDGLVELYANQEHKWFRKELKEYTTQITSAGAADLSKVVREVNHGLSELMLREQKAMKDIEAKYEPKKWGVYAGGAAGVATAAAAYMLPSLAPMLGVTAPAIVAATSAVGVAVGVAKERAGEASEKRRARKSLLGVLATVRPK
jgi:hypothetical protein